MACTSELLEAVAAVEEPGDALGRCVVVPFQPAPYWPSAKMPTASTPKVPHTPCTRDRTDRVVDAPLLR